jgi:cellulose synthase/poly-beta-1,6-N-acetylglucosamine synthase-like glycosyltransferase
MAVAEKNGMMLLRYLGEVLLVLGAVPLAYLALLGGAALLIPRRHPAARSLRVAVLVPAHNEAALIGQLIDDLGAQTRSPEIVLVVAHRCSDRTAEIARARGAQVLELATGTEKADALEAGFAWLSSREWDAVLVVDADCRIPFEFLEEVRAGRDEVVQSRYLLDEAIPRAGVMYAFLGRLEDTIFHAGRERLGCLAFLRGTGMLLGRDALHRAPWTSRGLTEDRSQTYVFLSAGVPIRLNERMRVFAAPPQALAESWNQRRRWLSSGLPAQIVLSGRAARRAWPHLGWRSWELPLAVWTDARSTWGLCLLLGTLLLRVGGGDYIWGLLLLGVTGSIAIGLGIYWYRSLFLRVLLEAPRGAAVILAAAVFGLAGRRPSAWRRGR